MWELEIYGGAANYLRIFPKRKFEFRIDAEQYIDRINEYLDELGVRAAHPMTLHNLHKWDIDNPESGPIEKFYLLKVHADLLKQAGFRLDDLRRMNCDEIRRAIAEARQ